MKAIASKPAKATSVGDSDEELTPQKRGGQKRTEKAAKKLMHMLEVIKVEIAANKGLYPYGRLSQAEVAKRAGVHKSTLHTPKGKSAGDKVHEFVKAYNNPPEESSQTPKKRKSLAERLQEKTFEFEGLLQSHQLTNTKLQQVRAENDKEREKNKALEHELAKVRALASKQRSANIESEKRPPAKRALRPTKPSGQAPLSGKVVPMRRKKPRP